MTGVRAEADGAYPGRRLDGHSLADGRLQWLLAAGRALVSELDLESVLLKLLETACELTGARYAAIGVLGSDRASLVRFVTLGVDEETRSRIGALPHGRGVLGVLTEEPRALRLADVTVHEKSYGFPVGHPEMRSFLGAPLLIRGQAWGNLYLAEALSGEFTEADEQAILVLVDWAGAAIENAHLYDGERRRREDLERAMGALEATTEIARAVGGEIRLDPVLELIVKRGRALVEARAMVILLVEGDDLCVIAAAGQVARELIGTRIAISESVGGMVLRSMRPERIGDTSSRLRFALAETVGANAGLLVPLVFRGRVVGVLEAFDRMSEGPEFSAEDERLLEAFAASAATAVATAQDVATQTLARSIESSESERARWARELHDETLQELAALTMALSSAQREREPQALQRALAAALESSKQATTGLREIISDLRPAALDGLGTKAALEMLADRTRTRWALTVVLTVDLAYESGRAGSRHTEALEAAIYRITQEAITNAVKHAHASRIDIAVGESDDGVSISILDDGCGFDQSAHTAAGFGLIGMRERVSLRNGTFRLVSEVGKGTRLEVTMPGARRPEVQAGEAAPESRYG